MISKWIKRFVVAAALAPALASADRYNLQQPQSGVAQQIYDLHVLILWICLTIFVGVFGAMLYSIVKHRKSVGHQAAQFHENTTVEIMWTIIPFLILIGMAWPATKTVLAMRDTSSPDMTVKVTGYQWKWGYDYLKGEGGLKDIADGISFYSNLSTHMEQIQGGAPKGKHYLLEVDNPLVVPVGKKIRILTTANDVVHSWWVPAFGVKQDAIPGFIRDTWFKAESEGTYRGQCAELCGKDHGFMPVVVTVVSQEKFAAWAAEQKKKQAADADDPKKTYTLGELTSRGEKVYASNCVACHQANGAGIPGTFPALSGSKIAAGPKDANISIVLNGKSGTAMAPFKHLSDVELASVTTYVRNAWNNKTGDMIQPGEIKAMRK